MKAYINKKIFYTIGLPCAVFIFSWAVMLTAGQAWAFETDSVNATLSLLDVSPISVDGAAEGTPLRISAGPGNLLFDDSDLTDDDYDHPGCLFSGLAISLSFFSQLSIYPVFSQEYTAGSFTHQLPRPPPFV